MGWPIVVLGRFHDWDQDGVQIGYSTGLRVTTNLNHVVTWTDDFNFTFEMGTQQDVVITCTHPCYNTNVYTKPPMGGTGGTLDIRGWHMRALSGVFKSFVDSSTGAILSPSVSLSGTTMVVAVNGGYYMPVEQGKHALHAELEHYNPYGEYVTTVSGQIKVGSVFMQFKGGTISGKVVITPANLGLSDGLFNGATVSLVKPNGSVARQIITPNGYGVGTYVFYNVPRNTYKIAAEARVAATPGVISIFNGLYGGGVGQDVVVTTSSITANCDITMSFFQ